MSRQAQPTASLAPPSRWLAAANWSAQQLLEMLMKPSVLAVNFGLRNLELLLRQLEFLLAIVGFLSLLLERRAHERGEPEQVEK
jgi:hypothetical protein